MEIALEMLAISAGAFAAICAGIIALNVVLVSRLRGRIPQERPVQSWHGVDGE